MVFGLNSVVIARTQGDNECGKCENNFLLCLVRLSIVDSIVPSQEIELKKYFINTEQKFLCSDLNLRII